MKHNLRLVGSRLGLIALAVLLLTAQNLRAQSLESRAGGSGSPWRDGIGSGYQAGVQTLSLEGGVNYGLASFGSREAHHLALGSLSYGRMIGGEWNTNHWYRGNLEWRLELFGGKQFSPEDDWLIGLTPHLRYSLATGTRWVPFLDLGAGLTATSIGPPDLSNTFEFNLQAGVGVHWFLRPNLALTVEARYMHLSCAGISHPNLGLNGLTGLIGVTRTF